MYICLVSIPHQNLNVLILMQSFVRIVLLIDLKQVISVLVNGFTLRYFHLLKELERWAKTNDSKSYVVLLIVSVVSYYDNFISCHSLN